MFRKILWPTAAALAVIAVAVFAVLWLNRGASTPPEEQSGTQLVEMLPAESRPDAGLPAQEEVVSGPETEEAYEFLLVNNNNYVAVYQLPENEIYEYTDVILDVLPQELAQEIRQGKYLRNEEELYNFLENYTS
ncbi:MAG: hypothetical protein Q4C82_05965 [Eubacteriales bacterium]|nr:hypothetical protein [Eubacteriales bacterium]